jgi:transposase
VAGGGDGPHDLQRQLVCIWETDARRGIMAAHVESSEGFSRRVLPVSNDTLLRVVRRRGCPHFVPPTVVGIDEWAWRRNQRYGTIICDLEKRKTIALLPDREPATAQAWLSDQPQITVVAHDRGGGYAIAAPKRCRRPPRSPIVGT